MAAAYGQAGPGYVCCVCTRHSAQCKLACRVGRRAQPKKLALGTRHLASSPVLSAAAHRMKDGALMVVQPPLSHQPHCVLPAEALVHSPHEVKLPQYASHASALTVMVAGLLGLIAAGSSGCVLGKVITLSVSKKEPTRT